MITVFLRGGLGNQMFQYALGLNLARKNRTELTLDTTFLNDRFPRPQFTYRTYDLDVFAFEPRFTSLSKASSKFPIFGVWLGFDLAGIAIKKVFGAQDIVKETQEGVFDPRILAAGPNTLLWGFWQSEKYFEGIAEEVRAAFRFARPLEGVAAALADQIRSCNSVSLHVRRGDYLLPKYRKEYGETNASYYERALTYIGERVATPTVFVFSDDIAWCRENIKPKFKTVYVGDNTRGYKSGAHLELMSMCRHHIITNSSFSWWGAWLDPRKEKIVIAPKQWHVNVGRNDVIVDAWVRF